MKNQKSYYLFIFFSTFSRNIIDIYSVIYLYQRFNSVHKIMLIYLLVYLLGIFISTLTLKLGNCYGHKYFLILSQLFTIIAYYLSQHSNNFLIIAIGLSLSIFTYHPIRHYYGLGLLKDKSKIGLSLIINYLSMLLSQLFIIKKLSFIYLIIISIVGIIPVIFIKRDLPRKVIIPKNIPRRKVLFFIFDQFKIIFLLLEPLYLYIIAKSISYIGVFNIILTISSIIYVYLIANKINIEKKYWIINIFFVVILFFKLNISNELLLLIIAFFEGIGIKTNELISTMNLYNYQNEELFVGYLIISEIIFCLVRGGLLLIIYLFNFSLTMTMYLLLGGIFLLSFMYQKRDSKSLI